MSSNSEKKGRINIVNRVEYMDRIVATPFHNILFKARRPFPGKHLTTQYRWETDEETFSRKLDVMQNYDYELMQEWFFEKCRVHNLPLNNAFTFWNCFIGKYGDIIERDPESVQKVIFAATCNFGDSFLYAETRYAPKDFVWLPEVMTATPDIQNAIKEELRRLRMSLPERTESVDRFSIFKKKWNQYYQSAKQYEQCFKRYSALNIDDSQQYEEDVKACYPLASIFRQYIHLLNEFSNSKYPDFDQSWAEFQQGKENCLLWSFQKIVCLLKHHEELELAQIAPVYVLLQFKKRTKTLYSSVDSLIKGKIPLSELQVKSDKKWKLFKEAQNNIQVRSNAAIIAYQLLCALLRQCPELVCRAYDEDLCNYMMQFICPLIGQRYYNITNAQFSDVFEGNRPFLFQDLGLTNCWVHSLLQEIDSRLFVAIDLYPNDIPRISEGICQDARVKELMPSICKMVDTKFLEEYFRILVYSPNGLGYPKLSIVIMKRLANLFDKALQCSNCAFYPRNGDYWSKEMLTAIEQCFHRVCNESEKSSFHFRVLSFLQNYLQSEMFYQSDAIFADQDNSLLI